MTVYYLMCMISMAILLWNKYGDDEKAIPLFLSLIWPITMIAILLMTNGGNKDDDNDSYV